MEGVEVKVIFSFARHFSGFCICSLEALRDAVVLLLSSPPRMLSQTQTTELFPQAKYIKPLRVHAEIQLEDIEKSDAKADDGDVQSYLTYLKTFPPFNVRN